MTRPSAYVLFLGSALMLGAGCATPSAATPAAAESAATAAPAAAAHVTAEQAQALVQSGARLVDVRTPEEFAAGHMEGALNVPLDTLQARAPGELGPRDAPVVVYCRTGRRSGKAAALLKELGFTQVHDLGPMPGGTPAPAK